MGRMLATYNAFVRGLSREDAESADNYLIGILCSELPDTRIEHVIEVLRICLGKEGNDNLLEGGRR